MRNSSQPSSTVATCDQLFTSCSVGQTMLKFAIAVVLFATAAVGYCEDAPQEQEKEDSQRLIAAFLPFAEEMLSQHGEFFPYGGAMTPAGDIISLAATDDFSQPSPSDLVGIINEQFRSAADNHEYRATALVYDAHIRSPDGDPSDAIAFNLDHESGSSIVVLLPYTLKNGNVEFGQVIAQQGSGEVFQ